MSGLVWTVGKNGRSFRSWIPEEEEQYAFLVMFTDLRRDEREAFELYEGLDDLAGKLPVPVREIASRMAIGEDKVRDLIGTARRKVERYYRANGLVIRREKPQRTAAEALDRLRETAAAIRAQAQRGTSDEPKP